jgi:transcriptional regulator with XRE-family HTH domain
MPRSNLVPAQEKLQLLLRQARQEARLTQADVAQKVGQPQSFVSKYESGERRLDILELRAVCSAIGLPTTDFIKRLEQILK